MLDKNFPLYILIFALSLGATYVTARMLIPRLAKSAQQPIYSEGPRWHVKKSGTPTMGGISFLVAISLSLCLGAISLSLSIDRSAAISILLTLLFAVSNALIGVVDDMKKLHRKKNKGLSPTEKLACQFAISILYVAVRRFLVGIETSLSFSFGDIDLGILYYPLAVILAVGIINCANLTDGIDGLASSVAFSIGVSLFYVSAALNTEAAIVSCAIIGASIGFLIFNLHPAKVFMGDTGSLFFGALIAAEAITLKNPLIAIFVAGVYVLEGVSVIIQVISYKLTKRRVFRMAPFHHHLEQCGWSENRICIVAMLATFVFSLPVYIFYLP